MTEALELAELSPSRLLSSEEQRLSRVRQQTSYREMLTLILLRKRSKITHAPLSAQVISATEPLPESRTLRRLSMSASFFTLFLAGWNGGATGALIPYIEKTFGITYAPVAILFISTFIGYLVAAAGAGTLARKNVVNSSQQKSFSFMCFGFFVVGSAFATQLGLCNAYFATLNKPLLWTGILHGICGLGAFGSPLVATAMRVAAYQ
ncbi:hypothetical protein AcW2_006088 [Taiwanofungus camphoratus]|nr:hypothetical protein AcW2_006088 [Antrodia cinnamomea]